MLIHSSNCIWKLLETSWKLQSIRNTWKNLVSRWLKRTAISLTRYMSTSWNVYVWRTKNNERVKSQCHSFALRITLSFNRKHCSFLRSRRRYSKSESFSSAISLRRPSLWSKWLLCFHQTAKNPIQSNWILHSSVEVMIWRSRNRSSRPWNLRKNR